MYGGNPDEVYLSGHSAGGNIVSLLVLGKWLNHLPDNSIKGVVCVSGVYSLYRPLGGACDTVALRNKVFNSMYVKNAFGQDNAVIIENSPVCILQIAAVYVKNAFGQDNAVIIENSPVCIVQIAAGVAPRGFAQCRISRWLGANPLPVPADETLGNFVKTSKAPPFLVFSAGGGSGFPTNLGDFGLERDVERLVQNLQRCGVPCRHWHTVSDCHHASICWTKETHDIAAQHIRAMISQTGVEPLDEPALLP